MPTVPDIHRRGTRAEQAALPSPPLTVGTLYFVTDEALTERWNGTTWDPYSGAGGSAPVAHAVQHQSGGADAIALDTLDAPTDVTTLNATAAAHGLLPKLTGDPATFLKGDGTFGAVPAGGITQLTGDVVAGPGAGAQAALIANDAVTFAKLQNVAPSSVLGRDATGLGDAQELAIGAGLTLTGTVLSSPRRSTSNLVNYTYNTGPEPPNAGQVRTDLGFPWGSTTKLWMRFVSGDDQDVYWGLMLISVGSTILLQDKDEHTKYARFITTGAVIDKGLYAEIPVAWVANGTSILTGSAVLMQGSAQTLIGHHTTHEPGGADALVALDAGILTTGTLSIARLADGSVTYAKLQDVSAASRVLGRGAGAGSGDAQELSLGAGLALAGAVLSATPRVGAVGIVLDGGGAVLTTGLKGFLEVPFAGTITGVTLLSTDPAVLSGSIVVDIWKAAYASYPPTVANTITAAAKPTLASATKSKDTTLTGWTTAIAAGDVLGFNVDSVATLTRVTLSLTVQAG